MTANDRPHLRICRHIMAHCHLSFLSPIRLGASHPFWPRELRMSPQSRSGPGCVHPRHGFRSHLVIPFYSDDKINHSAAEGGSNSRHPTPNPPRTHALALLIVAPPRRPSLAWFSFFASVFISRRAAPVASLRASAFRRRFVRSAWFKRLALDFNRRLLGVVTRGAVSALCRPAPGQARVRAPIWVGSRRPFVASPPTPSDIHICHTLNYLFCPY